MKKILLATALLALAACSAAPLPDGDPAAASSVQHASSTPSAASGASVTFGDYSYPNTFDLGENEFPPQAPAATFRHVLSIPFHRDARVLRVYSNKQNSQLALAVYDPRTKSTQYLGVINPVSFTGNSGGLFVPMALAKDDAHIILNAHMSDPGAGGSGVDYGYAMLPLKPIAPKNTYTKDDFPFIATRSATFYDSFGKVVYVAEGDNTPHYSKPGPSNDAAVIGRNLVTGITRTISEETDTSYAIVNVNEQANTVRIRTVRYHFSSACPRKEDGGICARRTTGQATVRLPAE